MKKCEYCRWLGTSECDLGCIGFWESEEYMKGRVEYEDGLYDEKQEAFEMETS